MLEKLCIDWLAAKAAEDSAKAEKHQIGKLIAELIEGDDESVSRMVLGNIKVAVTRKLNRSVDTKALQAKWDTLPTTVQETFRWKPDIDLRLYRALEFAAPADYAVAAQFVTARPATPAIEIEVQ